MSSADPAAIVYDARMCRPGMTGVGRCSLNLLHALAALPECPPIRALFSGEGFDIARRDPALANVECIAAPFPETHPWADIWLRCVLPRRLRANEVLHGPAFRIPGGRQAFARVVTIHDPIVFTHPETFPPRFAWHMRRVIREAARRADCIVTPTAAVAEELAAMGLAPIGRIAVIHLAPDATPAIWEGAAAAPDAATHLEPPAGLPLILTIGGPEPRKDPITAMRAAVALRAILGGGDKQTFAWWWAGREAAVLEIEETALLAAAQAAGFRFIPHAPATQLRAWMDRAAALASPSRAEGFNMTLVQAMAAGRPIVASDLPVHREVCGNAAVYFPAGDAGALAESLATLLGDASWRAERGAAAARRGADFSWRKAAEAALGVYRKVYSEL